MCLDCIDSLRRAPITLVQKSFLGPGTKTLQKINLDRPDSPEKRCTCTRSQTLCPRNGEGSSSRGSSEPIGQAAALDRRRPWMDDDGDGSDTNEKIQVEMGEVKEWIENESVAAGGVEWEGAIFGALVGDDDGATSGVVIALDQVKRELLKLNKQMEKQQQQLDVLTAGALRSGE